MSKSGSANVQHTGTSTDQSYNQPSADYMQRIWAAAQAAGAAGPSPLTTGAADYNTSLIKGGNLGMGALTGDPAATAQLMNPYQKNVVDATNTQWDQNDQHTINAVNDRATAAGAFGGSRTGVATGTALAANNMNRNTAVSGLLSTGYTDMMNRAGALAGAGFAGAGANANLGMGGVGSPQQWLLQMLSQGWKGPTGTQGGSSENTYGAKTEGKFSIPGFG